MIQWKDETSYSISDKERMPSIWEARINAIDICVHRHIHYPGKWLLASRYIGIEKKELNSNDIDEAKKEALFIVYKHLTCMQVEISNTIKQIKHELGG
uniref:Uncharacterized protein n=1 Tax=viral metagenome TaxID=1070528 RepID=A0A6H2A083_9ZZZZ